MNVDEGDSTIHLLCHGSSRDPMKIREYLKKFFEEHFDFLTNISSHILARKKMPVTDYMNYILSECQPFDEIAICCFARMYHIHIGIIMDDMYWTTRKDHDLKKCDKLLGFIGGLQFVSIKRKTTDDNTDEESEPDTSGHGSTPFNQGRISYNLRPRKDQNTRQLTSKNSPEPEGYNLCSRTIKESHNPKPKPKHSRPPKPKSPKGKPVKFVMQSYGLRRPRPRVRNFNCIICQKHFKTQGHLNQHIMTDHPTVRFTCSYCNRQFQTANGHYKHEQSHGIFAYKCPRAGCNKSFQFPSGLKAHDKVHTRKNLYKCLHCKNQYTTNRAMKAHAKKHNAEWIQCPKCPISFKTSQELNQHNRGRHGSGYPTPCGVYKQWPREVSAH